MLLQRQYSRPCRKTHKTHSQAQRVFKTAPLYAVTNPEESAPQSVLDAFAAFFESLWSPSTNPDGSTVQKAGMSYVYDEDGTLIAQTLTGGAQSSWGQSARYVYLPTASGPMPVAAIYGTKHYAIQSDHLNTPRRLIQSDGQVAWQWAYSAFGDEKPTTAKTRFANADLNQSFGTISVPAVTFNLRYPGQYFDQESDLHYNYHRSYSAKIGRYTQSDPIGLDGGWNRFGYVKGNPLGATDPSGLMSTDDIIGDRKDYPALPDDWRSRPPGSCSPAKYGELKMKQDVTCSKAMSCDGLSDPEAISVRVLNGYACLGAREDIMNQCFGGGDAAHRRALDDVKRAINKCLEKLTCAPPGKKK